LFSRGSPGEHGPVQAEEACPDEDPYLPEKQATQVPATPKVPAEHGWCTTHFVQDEKPPKKTHSLKGSKDKFRDGKKNTREMPVPSPLRLDRCFLYTQHKHTGAQGKENNAQVLQVYRRVDSELEFHEHTTSTFLHCTVTDLLGMRHHKWGWSCHQSPQVYQGNRRGKSGHRSRTSHLDSIDKSLGGQDTPRGCSPKIPQVLPAERHSSATTAVETESSR
jgi:hypothetical protein